MEEKRTCDGHCERCDINQRTYCAAQMAYYNQEEISAIKAMIYERNTQKEVQTIIGIKGNTVNIKEEENSAE